jgi:small-conductance mechanosensitive channel
MDKEELNLFQKAQFWILINLFKIELTVLIVLAICFMLDSYMKTNIIKVLAFGLLANAYLFTLKIEKDYSNTNFSERFFSNLSKYGILFVSIGFLFYVMKWPTSSPFVYIGQGLVVITFITFLIFKNKNPKSSIVTNELIIRTFVYSILAIYMLCFPLV